MNNPSAPPRFVPTLTDVVHRPVLATNAVPQQTTAFTGELETELIMRVMQRVDLVLERRLREAVGQLILAHTQTLGPRLREEIELVVRESVRQAVGHELFTSTGKTE